MGVPKRGNYLAPLSLSFHYLVTFAMVTLRDVIKMRWPNYVEMFVISSELCKYSARNAEGGLEG